METLQKTQHSKANPRSQCDVDFVRIEGLLTAAGIGFTIVDRCPEPTCSVCDTGPFDLAA